MLSLKHVILQTDFHMMSKQKKINRKTFFKWATAALAVPMAYVWQSTVSRNQSFSRQEQTLEIEKSLPDGVHFFGRVILAKENETYKMMSSKCTHLGCKINKSENGQLVCPCHGSRYDMHGNPLKGPATEKLQEIEYELEEVDGRLIFSYKF
jgi:Rieske Fe-S protein